MQQCMMSRCWRPLQQSRRFRCHHDVVPAVESDSQAAFAVALAALESAAVNALGLGDAAAVDEPWLGPAAAEVAVSGAVTGVESHSTVLTRQ